MLHHVTYVRKEDELIAKQIAGYLGVKESLFDSKVSPGKLVIGPNWLHQLAGHLTDRNVPIVVFDRHTDMYCTAGLPETEDSANWIYFALKAGRGIHLALTSAPHSYNSSSRLPRNCNLTVYSPRGASEIKLNREAKNGCLEINPVGKIVKPISDLSKLKSIRKQISFDEDFFDKEWKASELEALLAPIVNKGDTIDFWIEEIYYTRPQTIAAGLEVACSIL